MKNLLALCLVFSCMGAQAVSLSVDEGSQTALPYNFGVGYDGMSFLPTIDFINVLSSADAAAGKGIRVSESASLKYTYIGHEAWNENIASVGDQSLFSNKTSVFGDTVSVDQEAGLLDFSFFTDGSWTDGVGGVFHNGAQGEGNSDHFSFGTFKLSDVAYLLFFGDGAGDSDMDDLVVMVEVADVPLPAAFWFFAPGVLALLGLRRRQ